MLKQSILSGAALAALLSVSPAFAQSSPPDDGPQTKYDGGEPITLVEPAPDIVVSTGIPQFASQVGQAVTVIRRDEIERRQTVAISDLLATTPGVTVSRNGGLGTLTTVRIRGAEGEQTLTLIDGVRVNDPSSPGGGFDFASLLAGSVDRVEVLRGPNAVPWGSQALGGVVNVVTMPTSYGLRARANVEYGSFNSVFADAGISGGSGPITGSFNAGYLRTDGISAAASGTEPDGYRQYGAVGRVEVRLGNAFRLDLRGYFANSRTDIDGFASVAPFLPVDDPEYARTQELYGYAGLHADFADDRFKNVIAFTIADINRDNFDPTFSTTTPLFLARGRSERYQYQGDFQVINALRLIGGVEYEKTRFTDGTVFKSRGVTSVWGEAIVRPPVDDLTLTVGVRHDDDSAYGGHTSWGANGIYTFRTRTSIRASYAEGFKAPTLYQLYGPFGLGNPNLQPETARSYDIGLEQQLIPRFSEGQPWGLKASITWFHRDTRNQIDFDLGTFSYGNIARTRAEGVEIALDVRPTNSLTLVTSYSFIDSQNRSPGANFGKDLARRPHQSFSASVDWKTPVGLNLGATVLMVGDSFDDAANANRLDGYAILGVRADFPIGDRFSVYGRVDNVFDDRYTIVRGYGTPGRAVYGGIRMRLD